MVEYKVGDYVVMLMDSDEQKIVKIVGVKEVRVTKYIYEDDKGEALEGCDPWKDECFEHEIAGPSTEREFLAELREAGMYTGEENET